VRFVLVFSRFPQIASSSRLRPSGPFGRELLIYVGASLLGLRVLQRAFFLLTADDDLIVNASQVSIVLILSVTLVIAVTLVLLTRKLSGVRSAD